MLVVLFSILFSQGAVWYTAFFYCQFFIEKVLGLDSASVNILMITITVASAPFYVLFAALSDWVGRKPVMLCGMALAAVAFFPGFHELTPFEPVNPALARAAERPRWWSWRPIRPIARPSSIPSARPPSCRPATSPGSRLANAGVSYANPGLAARQPGPWSRSGSTDTIPSASAVGLSADQAEAVKADVQGRIKAALTTAGYPKAADPKAVNWPAVFAVMMVFVIAATALYGPMAASLVELFPTRIRYTAMSLPYNIGTGWIGGFLPAVSFAMVAVNGNMFYGLWYPVIIAAAGAVIGLIFLPETKGRDLHIDH